MREGGREGRRKATYSSRRKIETKASARKRKKERDKEEEKKKKKKEIGRKRWNAKCSDASVVEGMEATERKKGKKKGKRGGRDRIETDEIDGWIEKEAEKEENGENTG